MKNFDETRRRLRELGFIRDDRTHATTGEHVERWWVPPKYRRRFEFVMYLKACELAGIEPGEPSGPNFEKER